MKALGERFGFDYDLPLKKLNAEQKEILLHGTKEKIPFVYNYSKGRSVTYHHKFPGVFGYLQNYFKTTSSNHIREWVESFMNTVTCTTCNGGRLKKESLAIYFQGKNIAELTNLSIHRTQEFLKK